MVSVCLPSDPSCNIYHLTWVSLTLDMRYLFMVAPARHSHYSLPWTRSPLLTLNMEYLLLALLRLHSHRSFDMGLLLLAAALDLRHSFLEKCKSKLQ